MDRGRGATGDIASGTGEACQSMAALRGSVEVECLRRLERMDKVDPWRTVERFALSGASEHGPCTLLVFNQHQPQSDLRPFTSTQMINFCKANHPLRRRLLRAGG